jgi:hypothetical protein
MTITITVKRLMERGLWDLYCDVTGTNPFACNEGLMSEEDLITLDFEEAKAIGLLTEG